MCSRKLIWEERKREREENERNDIQINADNAVTDVTTTQSLIAGLSVSLGYIPSFEFYRYSCSLNDI